MSSGSEKLSDDEHYKYLSQRCDEFAKERESLIDAHLTVSERFDKWIIGLPAGATGLSLVFYEKVVLNASVADLGLLASSWILLSVATTLGFLSLYFSTLSLGRQIVIVDEQHMDFIKNSSPKKPAGIRRRKELKNTWVTWTRLANLFSVLTCVSGIVVFLYFAFDTASNNKSETKVNMSEKERATKANDGYVPPKSTIPKPPPKEESAKGYVPPKTPPPKPPKQK